MVYGFASRIVILNSFSVFVFAARIVLRYRLTAAETGRDTDTD